MAEASRLTVRLAPSIEHGLSFIAERETLSTAELARTILSASVRDYLKRHNLEAQAQDAYMASLAPPELPAERAHLGPDGRKRGR